MLSHRVTYLNFMHWVCEFYCNVSKFPGTHVSHGPLTRYVKLLVAHASGIPGTFSPPTLVSDPDMHHGTCVTHVPWYMPGSLISGFLWSQWRGKRSRRMRNAQFYVSGKRPVECHFICCAGASRPLVKGINSLSPSETLTMIPVKIDSSNVLSPDGTKPLPEPSCRERESMVHIHIKRTVLKHCVIPHNHSNITRLLLLTRQSLWLPGLFDVMLIVVPIYYSWKCTFRPHTSWVRQCHHYLSLHRNQYFSPSDLVQLWYAQCVSCGYTIALYQATDASFKQLVCQ